MKISSSQNKTARKKRVLEKIKMEARWDDALPDWPSRLLTYAVILVAINPILYFVFKFGDEHSFWVASLQVLALVIAIDVLHYVWYKLKYRKRKR